MKTLQPASIGLMLWGAVLLAYVYAASFPLNVASQSILAWSVIALLFVVQANYSRIEQQLGASLRVFRLVVIFLAVFVTLRYLSWRLTSTIGYHDPFSFFGALVLLAAELYGITEPPRILRRLLFPREWSHDETTQDPQILPRNP